MKLCPDIKRHRNVALDYRGCETPNRSRLSNGYLPAEQFADRIYLGECIREECIAYDEKKSFCKKYKSKVEERGGG